MAIPPRPDEKSRRTRGSFDAVLPLLTAPGALLAGFFLLLLGAEAIALLIPVGGIVGGLYSMAVVSGLWRRLLAAFGSLAMAGVLLFMLPIAADQRSHDELHDRIVTWVCAHPAAPSGMQVEACGAGGGVHNPSNGNSCGYVVTIVVRGEGSIDSIRRFYGRTSLPMELREVQVSSFPWAEQVDDDLIRVDWLAVGRPEDDLRCT